MTADAIGAVVLLALAFVAGGWYFLSRVASRRSR